MKIQPLKDLVLVKVDKTEKQTKSGLYIAEEWKSRPPTGIVQAAGPDVVLVKVGDRVVFDRYGSFILNGVDGDQRLCKESHIFGVLNEND